MDNVDIRGGKRIPNFPQRSGKGLWGHVKVMWLVRVAQDINSHARVQREGRVQASL